MAESHTLHDYSFILGNGILQVANVGGGPFVALYSYIANNVKFAITTPVILAKKGNPQYLQGAVVNSVENRLEMNLPEIDISFLTALKTLAVDGQLPKYQYRFVNYNGLYVRFLSAILIGDADIIFSDLDFANTNIVLQSIGSGAVTVNTDLSLVPIVFH